MRRITALRVILSIQQVLFTDHITNGQLCVDQHALCPFWATDAEDQCNKNPAYMLANCPISCSSEDCQRPGIALDCVDQSDSCKAWAEKGECQTSAFYMLWQCASACQYCEGAGIWAFPDNLTAAFATDEYGVPEAIDVTAAAAEKGNVTTTVAVAAKTGTTTTLKPSLKNATEIEEYGFQLYRNKDCKSTKRDKNGKPEKDEILGGITCEYDRIIALRRCAVNCLEDVACKGFLYSEEEHFGQNFLPHNYKPCKAFCVQKNFECKEQTGLSPKKGLNWYRKRSLKRTKTIYNPVDPFGIYINPQGPGTS